MAKNNTDLYLKDLFTLYSICIQFYPWCRSVSYVVQGGFVEYKDSCFYRQCQELSGINTLVVSPTEFKRYFRCLRMPDRVYCPLKKKKNVC